MLYLLLQAGADIYALSTDRIESVLPYAWLKQAPGTSELVDGILNYRGEQVAVVDTSTLLIGSPCPAHTSTRIVLCAFEENKQKQHIGLLCEHVTQVHRFSEEEFRPATAQADALDCLGPVASLNGNLIQQIIPEKILKTDLLKSLTSESSS